MNPELAALVAQVQELYEDMDFNSVKRWKKNNPGR